MLRKEAVELCAIAKQNQHAEFVLNVLRNAKVQLLAMPDVAAPISVQSLRRTCGESAPDIYSTRPQFQAPPHLALLQHPIKEWPSFQPTDIVSLFL